MTQQQNWFQPQQHDSLRATTSAARASGPVSSRRGRSPAPAFVSAALFGPAVIYACLGCAVAWTGWTTTDDVGPALALSLHGLLLAPDPVVFLDTATIVTAVTATAVLVLASLVVLRIRGARWSLAAVSFLVTAYHGYAVFRLVKLGVAEQGPLFVVLPIGALVLWLVPSVMIALPVVGRALHHV